MGLEYVTPEEAARRLKVSRWTIYRLIRDGRLPVARLGRVVRIPEPALDDLVEREPAPVRE